MDANVSHWVRRSQKHCLVVVEMCTGAVMKTLARFAVLCILLTGSEACFFPPQFQGEFKAQLNPGPSSAAGPDANSNPAAATTTTTQQPGFRFPMAVAGEVTSSMSSPVFSIRRHQQQQPGSSSSKDRLRDSGIPRYTKVFILPDGIPEWGRCLLRRGDDVIFQHKRFDGSSKKCFRCMQVHLRTRHVVQVYPGHGGVDKCHDSVGAALGTCPTRTDIQLHRTEEITLFKMQSFEERSIGLDSGKTLCPFSGRYSFTYSINDGTEELLECPDTTSTVAACPRATQLDFRFRHCSFPDTNMTVECLGEWEGLGAGDKFLAVSERTGAGVRYRCAMYREEPETRRVYLAFSEDSTCRGRLRGPHDGFETWVLQETSPSLSLSSSLLLSSVPGFVQRAKCRFPEWAAGRWQDLHFHANRLVFRDAVTASVFHIVCLAEHDYEDDNDDDDGDDDDGKKRKATGERIGGLATRGGNGSEMARFHVFLQDSCGEEFYTCLWLAQRNTNVLEYQLGQASSSSFNRTLCQDSNFQTEFWRTQGRMSGLHQSACPVRGEYAGVVPDGQRNICARLNTDCANPDILFYRVFLCSNKTYFLEEREYRCLGQWEENGVVYTYTQRRDVLAYECFVGVVSGDGSIHIKEAGEHCMRGQDPLNNGMQLLKTGSCSSGRNTTRGLTSATVQPVLLNESTPAQRVEPTETSTAKQAVTTSVAVTVRRRPMDSWKPRTTSPAPQRTTTWPWPKNYPTGLGNRRKPGFSPRPTIRRDEDLVHNTIPASSEAVRPCAPITCLQGFFAAWIIAVAMNYFHFS